MRVHHGTDCRIDRPLVLTPNRTLDFGPVANDQTIPVIQQYLQAQDKVAFAPLALALIRPDRLVDQVVFKTGAALECLELVEVIDLGEN